MNASPTALDIVSIAQELAQTRGYNGFSYKDIADRVGIRTASIHYHFPSKADLGKAMVDQYRRFVVSSLAEIDADAGEAERGAKRGSAAPERLRRYGQLLEDVLRNGNRMCLGGMLASDYSTLPAEVQREVRRFIDDNERWLARVLDEGRQAGSLHFEGSPEAAASALFSAIEGAMMTARSCDDHDRYTRSVVWLLQALAAAPAGARKIRQSKRG